MHSLELYPRRGISSGLIDAQRILRQDGLRLHTHRGTGHGHSRYCRRQGLVVLEMNLP